MSGGRSVTDRKPWGGAGAVPPERAKADEPRPMAFARSVAKGLVLTEDGAAGPFSGKKTSAVHGWPKMRKGSKPEGRDKRSAGSVHESPARRVRPKFDKT